MRRIFLPDLAHAARCAPLVLCALMAPQLVRAGAVSITDVSAGYSQNFDSLSGSYAVITRPWVNGTTLEGWYGYSSATAATAFTSVAASDGSGNNGFAAHFGSSGSTDRALGGRALASANAGFTPYWALALTNNTGADIASFVLNYDGEQWYSGGQNRNSAVSVAYGFGSSYAGLTWTSSALGFSSPVVNNVVSTLDGNADANRRANRGGTVNTTWAAGQTLWLRFAFTPSGLGGDNSLAIDNLSLSFTPAAVTPPSTDVPEPGSLALVVAGLAAAWLRSRR